MPHLRTGDGFTLVEALIASVLLAGALVTLAYVIGAGVTQTTTMRRSMTALVLAQSKLEELRALPWRFAADGSRISSAAFAALPAGSLTGDVDGYAEALDRFGAPANADRPEIYRRRWTIASWPPLDVDTLALQVCVFASSDAAVAATADACVAAIRTRKP